MIGFELVRPLGPDWRDTLDSVARAHGWPSSQEVTRLAASVAAMSAAYNDAGRARASVSEAGAARLGFAFARDVPKGAAAVRELLATGALPSERSLSVLDLGAGLGAMTWGLVRALRAAKGGALVEATWVDSDPDAMGVALEIVRERARGRDSELQVRPLRAGLDEIRDVGAFDVVLAGNLLSELSVGKNDEVRLEEHVHLLRGLLDRHTVESGALVIVEPALRERTRHLHRVRDALARLGVSVFAPCLHGQPCPALVLETDWCHESLPIDLPGWLVPVARAAGLRFERLTFSYLVLRKRGPVLRDAIRTRPSAGRLRVVSDVLATKGKSEVFLCGEFASSAAGGLVDARKRVSRLLRDERADGRSTASRPRRWVDLARGELLVIDPAPDLDAPRIGLGARVEAAGTPGESDGIDRG